MTKRKPDGGAAAPKSRRLEIREWEGMTHDRRMAEAAATPAVTAAALVTLFTTETFGELSLTDAVEALKDKIGAVQGGNLKDAEALLTGQAFALNTIFTELARRSAINMGQYLDASERYMRLALKAQGQCRTTLETLAAIKNPPVVFAKQANVTTRPQQINNGIPAPARAGEIETEQSKLLRADDGQWLDTRTAGASVGADPHLATVGAIDRTANG